MLIFVCKDSKKVRDVQARNITFSSDILLFFLLILSAPSRESALAAMRFAGLTDVSSVKQQPMMGLGDEFLRYVPDKLHFCLIRAAAACAESDAFCNAEDMRIHCHGGLLIDDRTDHVGCFSAHTGQRLQVGDVVRHHPVVHLYKAAGGSEKVLGFAVGIRDGVDVAEDVILGGF